VTAKSDIRRAIKALSAPTLHDALVTSAPLVEGKSAGYVIATVAGQGGVRVEVSPDQQPPVTPGDMIRVQAFGSPSATNYGMVNRVAGVRADSGRWTFAQQAIVNGQTYDIGDQLIGSPMAGSPNRFFDYSEGRWYTRIGSDVYQIDYADGSQLFGEAELSGVDYVPVGPNVYISASGVCLRDGEVNTIRLDPGGLAYLEYGLIMGAAGVIRSGKTDYGVGEGFWLGQDGGITKLDLGDADSYLRYDGASLEISGALRAQSLLIGDMHGPMIRGGVITDFDEGGVPVEGDPIYGLRIYDKTGLPKISLLTDTPDYPGLAAMLLGAETDDNYLWFRGGQLTVKGSVYAESGAVGGWDIQPNRLESTNGKIALVAEADTNFGEGVSLLTGTETDACALKWYLTSLGGTGSVGIDMTWIDESGVKTIVKQSQVSAVPIMGANAELRWVTSSYGGAVHVAKMDSYGKFVLGDSMTLKTKAITSPTGGGTADLRVSYTRDTVWLPGSLLTPVTNQGTIARVGDYSGYGEGPTGQMLTNAKEAMIPFLLPTMSLGCQVIVDSIIVYWHKAITAAYWTSIILGYWSLTTKLKVAQITKSLVEQGSGAAWYATEMLTVPIQMADAPYSLVFNPAGMTDPADLRIAGVRVSYYTQ